MKSVLFLSILAVTAGALAACSSGSSSSDSSSSNLDSVKCDIPDAAYDDAFAPGCTPEPGFQVCQVSSGATVLPDGGVLNGTESCSGPCGADRYEVSCLENPPPASMSCSVLPLPGPSGVGFYCCACAP